MSLSNWVESVIECIRTKDKERLSIQLANEALYIQEYDLLMNVYNKAVSNEVVSNQMI